jgi:hypothetical protein
MMVNVDFEDKLIPKIVLWHQVPDENKFLKINL